MSKITLDEITIRTILEPGDLGYIMYRHGKFYGEVYHYGIAFETYVGLGLYDFYKNYDSALDRVWLAEHHDKVIGSLVLMHRENNAAQLRYFLVEPDYQGMGLGNKLINLFMDFLRHSQYVSCYLWTTHELHEAAMLYTRNGFLLTAEKESTAFGKALKEQRYELLIKH